jgi:transposase
MLYCGIDLAHKTITCTLLDHPQNLFFYGETVANSEEGFKKLVKRVAKFGELGGVRFVMENTGVYGEKLCHFLHRQQVAVYVEPAHFIRRAFRLPSKTDPIDSRMIAEYGFRYSDQLHAWQPPDRIVEQIRVLMNNRGLLKKQGTAHKNIRKALANKEHQDMTHFHAEALTFYRQQNKAIEQQIKTYLKTNPVMQQHVTNLCTIPGAGFMFAVNFLILTDGFQQVNYRNLAGYVGIVPYPFQSGETVRKRPRSDKRGPDRMRTQLLLSAMAALKAPEFQKYFDRKTAEGKHGSIVMNNIKNKLLRIACAVVLSGQPYDAKYKSVRIIK